MSNVMVIDLKKCIGCHACTVACKAAHGTPTGVTRAHVEFVRSGSYPTPRRDPVPMLCMQCSNPSCMAVCPVGATYQTEDGIVAIDKGTCIGCGLCKAACPYGARYIVGEQSYFGEGLTEYEQIAAAGMPSGTADKCNWCKERVDAGGVQACVAACPAGARTFGDYEELKEMIELRGGAVLNPELGTEPNVYYLPNF